MTARVLRSVPRARRATCWLVAVAALFGASAAAQERGFELHRYGGTSAGSSLFLVERPWYSSVRLLAAGVTLDYSHDPLEPRVATGRGLLTPIVSHALVGHVDLAFSLFDRVQLSASLPVTFLERGTPEFVSQVGPLQTIGLGDPRIGLLVRLAGQPDRDAVSLHLGALVWVPIGAQATHQGDSGFRVMPRALLAGAFGVGRWTLDAAFLYRPYASFGPPGLGMTAASEARVGFAIGVALAQERLYLGPEAQFAVQVVGDNAFSLNGMNLELLGGAHYLIADRLLVGVAGGSAFFGAAGTPDARAVVRLAWAPRPAAAPPREDPCANGGCPEPEPEPDDPDGDGISTAADRCPYEPETRNGIRDADGCPEFRMERGTAIARVLAPRANPPPVTPSPKTAAPDAGGALASTRSPSATPDAGAPASTQPPALRQDDKPGAGAPALDVADSDSDGVPDEADRCPVTPEDVDGFEDEDGCPEPDNDQDGVPDVNDRCPDAAETPNGISDDDGCPDVATDVDEDGVADAVDRCPFEPENRDGVRDEDGCPEYPLAAAAALARLLPRPPPANPLSTSPADEPSQAFLRDVDSDQDGVTDDADRCPLTAEDLDGFEDGDGCREPDNDDDGIPDVADRCPDAAETVNGWKDDDGCPDEPEDVDGDGVDYEADRCPLEPGTASDGCPHAPLPALALSSFASTPVTSKDGATPTSVDGTAAAIADFDRDGLPDEADACPASAEDRDDFEDEDGCPEPDNDHDGIPDVTDKCPLVAETINGVNDADGCPDVGAGAVSIRAGVVVIKGVVRFQTGSANLQRASLPLLQQVASTLRAAASLSIEIRGHTDDVGNAAQNIRLSKRRAETIRAVLIKAGVAPSRLVANGYGPTRPVASNKTGAGREQNRRVEFLILGESK